MLENRSPRTALLIDVATFGGPEDTCSEPDPFQFADLPFGTKADDLSVAFTRLGYQVKRHTNPTAAQLEAEIRDVVNAHRTGDVVAVHIVTHGHAGKIVEDLHILGSDGTPGGPSVAMTPLLRDFNTRENGPHILFSLDLCHAGLAVDLDWSMRLGEPDKVWIVAASASDESAFDARLTEALRNTLDLVRTGLPRVDRTLPYVPFTSFAPMVRKEVDRIGKDAQGVLQRVTGTRIDSAQDVDNLPFFDNRAYIDGLGAPLQWQQPTMADVPDELEYFVGAANIRFDDGVESTDFTGRIAEVRTLLGWLHHNGVAAPQLLTGRAGTGKSAMLGALVCATHPDLAERLTSIAKALPIAVQRPERMAAVPARHRDIAGFVTMISSQLWHTKDIHTPEGLLRRLGDDHARDSRLPPVVIVVDSLDEAVAPEQVFTELLLPLSRLTNERGNAGCRVLVASRSASEVTSLIRTHTTSVVDLDDVDPILLRRDVEAYATTLLSHLEHYLERPGVRGQLAGSISRRLVAEGTRLESGEFLVARLYVHHLLEHNTPITTVDEAEELGGAVPLDITAVLELDLAARKREVWSRPVLAALALVQGLGAPASVVTDLAGLCAGRLGQQPAPREVAAVLGSVHAYLRVLPASDGNTRYQLFHDSLAEHLRAHPRGPGERSPISASEVCLSLIGGVGSWKTATPYVLRHVLRHARGTALLEELLENPDFLLCGRSEALLAVTEVAEDQAIADDVRGLALAAQTVMTEHQREPADRNRLAIVAARAGSVRLARALGTGTYRPVLALGLPRSPVTAAPQVLLSSSDGTNQVQVCDPAAEYEKFCTVRNRTSVMSLCTNAHGEIATGDDRGTVRLWPLTDCSQPRMTRAGHNGVVRAIAALEQDGEPPAFISADDRTIRVWRADTGAWLTNIPSPTHDVTALSPFTLPGVRHVRVLVQSATRNWVLDLADNSWAEVHDSQGHTVLCPGPNSSQALHLSAQGAVTTVDLATYRQHQWFPSTGGLVTAAAHVPGMPSRTVVSGDSTGRLVRWYVDTQDHIELGRANGQVTALTSFVVDGKPWVVCASSDGMTSVWDPTSGVRHRNFAVRQHIRLFAHNRTSAGTAGLAGTTTGCGWGFGGVILAMVDENNAVQVRSTAGPDQTLGPFDRAIARVSVVSEAKWARVVVEDDQRGTQAFHPFTGQPVPDFGPAAGPPDQRTVLVHDQFLQAEGGADGVVRMTGNGHEIEFTAHSGAISALAAWPHDESAHLATGGTDGFLRVWDAETRTRQYEIPLPSPATSVVAVRENHLVVQSEDEVIVLSRQEST